MIFAKLDVELRDHLKAHRAGASMATWTWALCWTRAKEEDGFVAREALRGAWVGETQAVKDMSKLVSVELAEPCDGGWMLLGYAEKNETKSQINQRRAEGRARKQRHDSKRKGNASDGAPGNALPTRSGMRDERVNNATEPEPEPEPEPDLPLGVPPLSASELQTRAVAADGLFDGSPEVYRRAMAAALGNPQGPLTTWERKDLAGLIATHAGRIAGPALEAWLAEAATGFAASGKAPFGARPKHLAGWLDAGRPAAAKPSHRARPSTLQGHGKDDWDRFAAPPIGDETP